MVKSPLVARFRTPCVALARVLSPTDWKAWVLHKQNMLMFYVKQLNTLGCSAIHNIYFIPLVHMCLLLAYGCDNDKR